MTEFGLSAQTLHTHEDTLRQSGCFQLRYTLDTYNKKFTTMEGEVMQENAQSPQRRVSFGLHTIIYLAIFLLPVFAIPISTIPFQFSKTVLALIAAIIVLFLLLFYGYKKSNLQLTWSPLLISLWAIPLVYLIASIFSQSPSLSFFGYQLDTDTFGFMLLGAFIATVIAGALTENRLMGAFKAFGVGAIVVLVFQLVQVILGAPLPFSALGDPIINLVGRWNDFGVFAGLVGVLSLLAYSTLPQKIWLKITLGVSFLVSVFFLALVNVTEIWALFSILSLGLFVLFLLRFVRNMGTTTISAVVLSGIGVLAGIIFIIFGGFSATLQSTFAINSLEVRPSLQGTTDVLQRVYAEEPVLGTGPNTFAVNWLLHRPDAVLSTIFWNTSFDNGSGMIPTAAASGGVLVLVAWIVFTLAVLYSLIRALFTVPTSGKAYTATVFSAVGVFYLLVMHYIYAPSQSVTLLLFIFLGLFLASIRKTSLVGTRIISIDTPRLRQAYVVGAVLIVLVSVFAVYGTARTYASGVYHERAIAVANEGDLDTAQRYVDTSITLRGQDRYYRTAALISLAKMNEILDASEEVTDEARTAFQTELVRAIGATASAVEANDRSYQNWITRGVVYANVVPLGIDGAFENATATFEEARVLSPKSPEVDFRLAEVHLANGDTETARTFLQTAVQKKANYTDAVLLLAQLELDSGDLSQAIESVRSLVFFEPNNPVLLYQLGILLLQDQNYEEASLAFEAALVEQNNYSNAAFFLAQSYAFLDRIEDAAGIMSQLATLNPENELVAEYAAILSQGENPFDSGEVATPEEDLEAVQ